MMFASRAPVSGELFSFNHRVLLHDDRAELEWLIPGITVVALPGGSPSEVAQHLGREVMLWRDHPDMASVRWPLNRKDFVT